MNYRYETLVLFKESKRFAHVVHASINRYTGIASTSKSARALSVVNRSRGKALFAAA